MRSKASIKSHPLHPMLIAFPIAFATAAPLADLAAMLGDWPSFWTVGAYSSIAAVVTGLIAAVPGLIDYLMIIPPHSSAKKRATYHMIVNVVALAVMAGSWAFRDWETLVPQNIAIVLEFASIAIMSVGGWLGATLIYRNQIGVDHRYAEAGKWQEQYLDADANGYVHVRNAEELDIDQMILVHVDGRRLVLARTEKGFTAFDDSCTHRGGSLAGGMMTCGTVMCAWHGSQFDVHTGALKAGPAKKSINAYEVDHSTGDVRIFVGSKNAAATGEKVVARH
jgi:uncharacterized membrane protein/nitrite reductase/ring-hydroxylating ferredoxin subunit